MCWVPLCHFSLSPKGIDKLCPGGGGDCVPLTQGLWASGKVGWHGSKGPSLDHGRGLVYGSVSFMAFLIHFSWPGINVPINTKEAVP